MPLRAVLLGFAPLPIARGESLLGLSEDDLVSYEALGANGSAVEVPVDETCSCPARRVSRWRGAEAVTPRCGAQLDVSPLTARGSSPPWDS